MNETVPPSVENPGHGAKVEVSAASLVEESVTRVRTRGNKRATVTTVEASPFNLKEGDVDPETGYKIARLIGAYETCIIYLDEAQQLHYRSTSEHEWPDSASFAAIEVEADYLRAAAGAQLNERDTRQSNFLVGEAIAFALASHDFVSAKNALDRVRELLGQGQRIRIVLITLGLLVFGTVAAVAVGLLRAQIQQALGNEFFEGLLCAAAGGGGAALSVMQRTGQLPLPVTARPGADLLECVARFTVGVFAGATLYLAISANLFLGIVNKIGDGSGADRLPLILGLALAAGASERAFPKLVRSFEKAMH